MQKIYFPIFHGKIGKNSIQMGETEASPPVRTPKGASAVPTPLFSTLLEAGSDAASHTHTHAHSHTRAHLHEHTVHSTHAQTCTRVYTCTRKRSHMHTCAHTHRTRKEIKRSLAGVVLQLVTSRHLPEKLVKTRGRAARRRSVRSAWRRRSPHRGGSKNRERQEFKELQNLHSRVKCLHACNSPQKLPP